MSAPLDRLTHVAAGAEPPPLDDLSSRRFIERALAPAPAPARRSYAWVPVFALGAVVAAVIGFVLWPRESSPVAEPLRVALPTGDRLVGIDGARFEIEELAPASRRFRLHEGSMLFDVARTAPAQRVEVATTDLVVVVTGTVFSVTVTKSASHVRVYEGSVEIRHRGRVMPLDAGKTWSSGTTQIAESSVLLDAATTAMRERLASVEPGGPGGDSSRVGPGDSSRVGPGDSSRVGPGTDASRVGGSRVGPGTDSSRVGPGTESSRVPGGESRVVVPGTDPKREPPVESTPPRVDDSLDALLVQAREHVLARRFAEALADVKTATKRGASGPAWSLVTADAYRGLRKPVEAAEAFDAAATKLVGAARLEAAYSAAYLRFHDLHDGKGALASLDVADAAGSPLEERALGLRVQILASLRRPDARERAKQYLARFPRGGLRAYMLALLR